MRPRGDTQKRYTEALECLSRRKSPEKTGPFIVEISLGTMKLRESTPVLVLQLWNAIAYIRQQKQIPNFERLAAYMKRNHDTSAGMVEAELKKAVSDGLLKVRTAMGCKGSKVGVEQDGYRIPQTEMNKGDHDWYCFNCHKGGDVALCSSCYRVFHLACIEGKYDPVKFVCNVCKLQKTKYGSEINKNELNALLSHTSVRLKEKTRELHRIPHPSEEKWRFDFVIYKHMDLVTMEQKIRNYEYKTLEEYYIDALQVVHNVFLFYGDSCRVAVLANQMLQDCDYDLNEISQCRDCYTMSNRKDDKMWFCQPCNMPHELVFAKQKGFPYWPAKVMKKSNGQYDVRFFGGFHQRAFIDEGYIKPITITLQQMGLKKTVSLNRAMKELNYHKTLIERKKCSPGIVLCQVKLDKLKNGRVKALLDKNEKNSNPKTLCDKNEKNSNPKTLRDKNEKNSNPKAVPATRPRPGRPSKIKREEDSTEAPPQKRKKVKQNYKEVDSDENSSEEEEEKQMRRTDNDRKKKAERERKRKAEVEKKQKTGDEKKMKIVDEKKRKAECEKKTEDESKRKKEEEKKRKAEDEKRNTEEEKKKKTENEKRKKTEEDKKRKSDEDKKRKTEEDKKKAKSEEKKNCEEMKDSPESQPEVLPNVAINEDQNIVSSSSQEALVTYVTVGTQTISDDLFETSIDESSEHLEEKKKSCNCKEKYGKMFTEMNESLENEHKEEKTKALQDLSEKLQKEFEADKQKAVSAGFVKLRQKMEQLQKKSEEQNRQMHEQKIQKLVEHHKQQISETKKKQWCYNCEAEAIYHCCWNTAYCSVECQQSHWHKEHKRSCRRKRS